MAEWTVWGLAALGSTLLVLRGLHHLRAFKRLKNQAILSRIDLDDRASSWPSLSRWPTPEKTLDSSDAMANADALRTYAYWARKKSDGLRRRGEVIVVAAAALLSAVIPGTWNTAIKRISEFDEGATEFWDQVGWIVSVGWAAGLAAFAVAIGYIVQTDLAPPYAQLSARYLHEAKAIEQQSRSNGVYWAPDTYI